MPTVSFLPCAQVTRLALPQKDLRAHDRPRGKPKRYRNGIIVDAAATATDNGNALPVLPQQLSVRSQSDGLRLLLAGDCSSYDRQRKRVRNSGGTSKN